MPPLEGRGRGQGELRSGGNVGQLLLARVDSGKEPTVNHPTRSLVQVLLCKPATTHRHPLLGNNSHWYVGWELWRGKEVYDSHGKV